MCRWPAYAAIVVLTLTANNLLGISEVYVSAMLLYGSLGVFLATRSEALAVLRLSDRVHLGLAVTLAAALTSLGLIILAWRTGGGLSAVVTAYAAAAAVNGTGMAAAAAASARKAGVGGFLGSLSLRPPSDVIKFQFGTFARTKLVTLEKNLDFVLMAQFAPAAEVGIYRAARVIIDVVRRPFRLIRFGVQPGVQQAVVLGPRGRAAALVSQIHHHVALGGRRWACASRHTSQAHYPTRTWGRICGSIHAIADHDPRGIRRQHGGVQHSARGHRPQLARSGVGDSGPPSIGRRASVACTPIRGRGSGVGQNYLLAGIGSGVGPVHSVHSATELSDTTKLLRLFHPELGLSMLRGRCTMVDPVSVAKSFGGSIGSWLEEMGEGLSPGRFRFCKTRSLVPSRGKGGQVASCFAARSAWYIGAWENWSWDTREGCKRFIKSFQQPDGNFVDQWLLNSIPWSRRLILAKHGRFREMLTDFRDEKIRAVRAETKQSAATLRLVGDRPKYPLPMIWDSEASVREFVRSMDWTRPWGAGSHTSHLVAFFVMNSEMSEGSRVEVEMLEAAFSEANRFLDPNTGSWGMGEVSHVQRINGAMKMLSVHEWANRPIPYPDRLIDYTLNEESSEDGCGVLDRLFCSQESERSRSRL